MATRILVVDDHAVLRATLSGLLAYEPDIEVVGQCADGWEAIELTERLQPDVIFMDANMPRMNGIEATREIAGRWPAVRIIGLSMHDGDFMAPLMRQAGAVGYVVKSAPLDVLIAAIREAR